MTANSNAVTAADTVHSGVRESIPFVVDLVESARYPWRTVSVSSANREPAGRVVSAMCACACASACVCLKLQTANLHDVHGVDIDAKQLGWREVVSPGSCLRRQQVENKHLEKLSSRKRTKNETKATEEKNKKEMQGREKKRKERHGERRNRANTVKSG